jgi:hypothetical protein
MIELGGPWPLLASTKVRHIIKELALFCELVSGGKIVYLKNWVKKVYLKKNGYGAKLTNKDLHGSFRSWSRDCFLYERMFVFIEDSSLDLISPNFQVESLVCLLNWVFNALNRLKFSFSTMVRDTLDFESSTISLFAWRNAP